MVADGDVVLALSASGETEEMLRILPAIARFQVKIIAVCGDAKSTLAQKRARFSRCEYRAGSVSAESRADFQHDGHARAGRRAGDGVARGARISKGGFRQISSRRNDRPQPAHARPPDHAAARSAGAGRARHTDSRRLENDDRVSAPAPPSWPVKNGQLLGIFTHGDFVRHFQSDSKVGERLVGDLMTLNPVTVHKDKLAVEVLNLLERHRIDDLVVVDDNKCRSGLSIRRI